MRQNYSFSKNGNALLEPCEGKLSCTVLRGESPSNGADLLDTKLIYAIGAVVGLIGGVKVYDLHGKGITPDVEVELDENLKSQSVVTPEEDNQVQAAMEALKEN